MIEGVSFGEIKIKGKIYYSDIVIDWKGNVELREKSHIFDINEFFKLLKRKPEIIVVGNGFYKMVKISKEVIDISEKRGIRIFEESTPKAIEIFNAFVNEGKRVIGIIHTTC